MTPPGFDPYAVLGLAPDATPDQITRAYHGLLRRHHPDTRGHPDPDNPQQGAASDTTLQQILAAYAVLRERARRADSDAAAGPPPGRPPTTAVRRTPVRLGRRQPGPRPPIQAGPVHWRRA